MTRAKFISTKFKAYMSINYIQPRSKEVILCMLLEVDFDEQTLTLEPFDKEYYKDMEFVARCENCFIL